MTDYLNPMMLGIDLATECSWISDVYKSYKRTDEDKYASVNVEFSTTVWNTADMDHVAELILCYVDGYCFQLDPHVKLTSAVYRHDVELKVKIYVQFS